MLEDSSMICIIDDMHRSKRNLTPMIYDWWIVVISIGCVALLDSITHSRLLRVLS
jgi:hypothetical protein